MKTHTQKTTSLLSSILTLGTLLGGALQSQAQPAVNAPTPNPLAANVVSMYNSSGTYTDHGGIGWYANWSGVASMGDYTIAGGNTVKSYLGLSYAGVEYYAENKIDATACNTMHVDLWTTANQFAIKLVSTAGLNGSGTAAPEVYILPGSGKITSNTWVSLDIPLKDFKDINPNLDLASLDQLLWIDNGDLPGGGVQLGDFYIDNVYFYSNTVVAPSVINYPTNSAPLPTQPATNVLAMFNSSGTYENHSGINWRADWSGANYFPFTITNTTQTVLKYTGLNYDGVEFYDPAIDASGYNTLHVDLWTPNANQFGIQLVSLSPTTVGPQVDFLPASGIITTNHWVSLDIPLSKFTDVNNALVLSDLQQLLWIDNQNGGGATLGTFYIDNVYFYNAAVATAPLITSSLTGGSVHLSFATQNGFSYTVEYKTNLTDAVWQTLSTVSGNGSVQMIPDTANQKNRFYRVSAH